MRFYIDENMPPALAKGLGILETGTSRNPEVEILSIREEFGRGAKDEDWLPIVGKEGEFVVTQDRRIQSTPALRDLYLRHKVGLFFIKAPSKKGYLYWEMLSHIIHRWPDIKEYAKKHPRPFAVSCTKTGKFEKLG